jgi:uncharacterized membrane protein
MLGSFLYCLGNIPYVQKEYNSFSLAYKLTGLSSIFITLMILTCSIENSYKLVSVNYILPVVLLMIFNFLNLYFEKSRTELFKLETGFIFTILILLLFALTTSSVSTVPALIVIQALIILIVAAGFSFGYKFENVKLINLSTTLLIIYVLTTYCRWGWSFFNKALFFILGGVILIGLGLYLERKKKEIIKGDK